MILWNFSKNELNKEDVMLYFKIMADAINEGLISFKWNNHSSTFFNILATLRSKETYTDATLACEGKFYPVHKLVLSTCSDYFYEIFENTNCRSPVVILKDIRHSDLESLLDYMYVGEVDVRQSELSEVLKTAECLRVKGLAVPDDDANVSIPSKKELLISDDCNSTMYLNKGRGIISTDSSLSSLKSLFVQKECNFVTSQKNMHDVNCTSNPPSKRVRKENKEINCDAQLEEKTRSSLNDTDLLRTPNAVELSLQYKSDILDFPVLSVKGFENPKEGTKSSSFKSKFTRKSRSNLQKKLNIKSKRIKIMKKNCNSKIQYSNSSPSVSMVPKKKSISTLDNIPQIQMRETDLIDNDVARAIKNSPADRVNDYSNDCLESAGPSSQPSSKNRKAKIAALESEEFCNNIGLPIFSEALLPYIEGHDIRKKDQDKLSNLLIEELIIHLNEHKMFVRMHSNTLRSNFYYLFQLKVIEKYPNIIREECNRKNGKKGPLSSLINKLADRMNGRYRKLKQVMNINSKNEPKTFANVEDEYVDQLENIKIEHNFEGTLNERVENQDNDLMMCSVKNHQIIQEPKNT